MFLIVCLMAAGMKAQDWPQFLGPGRDLVYAGPGRTPAGLAWKKPVGAGFSAPVVAQGKLIVFHRQGNKEMVEAWDAASGAKIWSYFYPTSYRDDFGFDEGPRAAPLVDGGRVYTHGAEGQLHAVNLADGKKVWSEDTMTKFGVRKGFFGVASSPVIDGDLLMVNIGGRGAGVVAFDKNTGKVIWSLTDDEASYSSPVVVSLGGLKRALFLTRAGLLDIDPAAGKVRHQMAWRSRSMASVNAATPVAAGDILFLSASYGTGAIALEVKGANYRKLWSNDDSMSSHYSTAVQAGGFLYGFHGRQEEGQELRCVDLKTGKVQWSVEGMRAGTVALAGDTLLVLRENGELVVAKADPKKFQPVSKHALIGGTVRSYPAYANGRMYVRNEDTLACYRLQ
jgi:outer membrane protein assembly factor BamB